MPEATGNREASGGHIVLLGMMGSGKTTIGTRLATHLERPFIDSDEVLLSTTGREAARIAGEDGVEALHAIEAELLLDSLGVTRPAVIAAASSADRERIVPSGRFSTTRASGSTPTQQRWPPASTEPIIAAPSPTLKTTSPR